VAPHKLGLHMTSDAQARSRRDGVAPSLTARTDLGTSPSARAAPQFCRGNSGKPLRSREVGATAEAAPGFSAISKGVFPCRTDPR
jgi:hypothetical protein